MLEAGFSKVDIYWEGTTKDGEGDGKIGDLDTSNLVGPERLSAPGDSDGQIIMVKTGKKVPSLA